MKPPFQYYGGKTALAAQIAALLPDHKHYVEPFAGSLAVLLAKPRLAFETVNDLDGRLMTFWRVLRDRPEDLVRVCELTPHSRAEYRAAYDLDVPDEVEIARRVWVILTQGRAGSFRPTGWRFYENPDSSSRSSMPRYVRGYVDRLGPAAERLIGVQLECRPALEIIANYGEHPGVLIYADPPYLRSTRASRQYGVEMSSDEEHEALADALKSCQAAVVLSGYHSTLYDRLYGDWCRVEIPAIAGNGAAGNRGRTEVLWSNRPFVADSYPTLFAGAAS